MPSSSPPASVFSPSVFWPRRCRESGLCYGWMSPAICVVGVLDDGSDDDQSSTALAKLSSSSLWKAVSSACGSTPAVLGRCRFDPGTAQKVPSSFTVFGQPETVYSFVLYDAHTPNSLRFYSLEPPRTTSSPNPKLPPDPYHALAAYDFTRPTPRNLDKALNDVVIHQLNASFIVRKAIESPSSQITLLPITASFLLALASRLTFLTRVLLALSRYASALVSMPLYPQPTLVIILNVKPKVRTYFRPKDLFATVQQFDVRMEQATFFLTQVASLRRQNTRDVANYSIRYTNFFNTAWLIMNDMIFGLACGTFLRDNSNWLSDLVNSRIQELLVQFPRTVLYWLDAWPAGLKLNAQLSRFYVNTLVGIINTWASVLPPITPSFFVTLGTISSIGGLTLLLSVLSDALSLLTAHIRVGYELTRGVYWSAGIKLGGGLLWGVFRGKRRNVLRNRNDTWSYDIDQLLFGTVLFTLLAFLFPTALVYYLLFAGLRLAILLVQAAIETLLAFMHHFPLFALMLRLKDPLRLPVSVFFKLHTPRRLPGAVYLSLESQAIPISSMFFQYNELWSRLARHYNPLRLLYRLLSGEHLGSIPPYSIRYSLDPQAPMPVGDAKEKQE